MRPRAGHNEKQLTTTPLRGAGDADQVALRVGEVADHQASRGSLRAHLPCPAKALCLLQGGFDIGHANVENRVARVARATADAAWYPGPVVGRDAVHEPVVQRFRHRLRDRRTRVELPPEEFAVVAPELRRVRPDDLEVHHWLSHDYSRRLTAGARGGGSVSYDRRPAWD